MTNKHRKKTTDKIWNILGYASGIAAGDTGCGKGPKFLRESDFLEKLKKMGINAQWSTILFPKEDPALSKLKRIANLCRHLALCAQQLAIHEPPFIVIGGDHSSAIGTWSGVAEACQRSLGLIWIDAHLDSHTPATSLSKNIHGMPVACLLGHGKKSLTNIIYKGAKILPENLTIIGARSYESAEESFLKELKVKVFYNDDIKRDGIAHALKEAHHRATNGTEGFGISIDLDVLDPKEAPGVGTPAPDGLHADELSAALTQFAHDPKLKAIEFVEFNPHHDKQHLTVDNLIQLLSALIIGKMR